LGYITGDKVRDKILLEYYNEWRFKHPNPNDFIRVAEKASGMELDWYKEYWVNSTKTIDYAIDSLWDEGGKTKIRVRRVGEMPMPLDVQLTFKDGSKELHYMPLNLMYGQKPIENDSIPRTVHEEWRWTHPTYTFETNRKLLDLTEIDIDPSERLADVDRRNNTLKLKW
jgi:aminopeptidase N